MSDSMISDEADSIGSEPSSMDDRSEVERVIVCPLPSCRTHSWTRCPLYHLTDTGLVEIKKRENPWQTDGFLETCPLGPSEGSGVYGDYRLHCHIRLKSRCLVRRHVHDPVTRKPAVEEFLTQSSREKLSPFVTNYLSMFVSPSETYFVVEYLPLGSLEHFLYELDFLWPETVTGFVAFQLVHALEFLSERRIAHRAVCPSNVMVAHHGLVKLANFQQATQIQERAYTQCGQLHYRSPEMLSADGYDTSVDWWSLGVLIFRALNGCTPFEYFVPSSDDTIANNIRNGCGPRMQECPRMSSDAHFLLSGLLHESIEQRLRYVNGSIGQVKDCPWFDRICIDRAAFAEQHWLPNPFHTFLTESFDEEF